MQIYPVDDEMVYSCYNAHENLLDPYYIIIFISCLRHRVCFSRKHDLTGT